MTKLLSIRSHVRRSPSRSDAYVVKHAELRVELAMEQACQEILSSTPGTLPPLPMPMPGNPEAGSTPGTAAPASDEFMLTGGIYHPLERE